MNNNNNVNLEELQRRHNRLVVELNWNKERLQITQQAFDYCLTARNAARAELRAIRPRLEATTEQLDRQVAVSANIYGLNTRLVDHLERLEMEKSEELRRLADECQALRVKNKSLEDELERLHALLAFGKQSHCRQQEEIQRLNSERDAIEAEKNAQIARLEGERDAGVHTLNATVHKAYEALALQNDQTEDEVRRLEAKYAEAARDMEAKSAQLAREKEARAAELNAEKDDFIRKLRQRGDYFREKAAALGDRRLHPNPFMISRFIQPNEQPEQQQAQQPQQQAQQPQQQPQPEMDDAYDQLQFLSLD